MRRLPLLVAVGVAVLGLLFVSAGYGNPGSECSGPESYYLEDVSWPPGAVRCEGHRASGAHYHWIAYPWDDVAFVVLFGAAAGLLTAALMRGRAGFAWAAVAGGLLFAALFGWFFQALVVWIALAALTAAAVASFSRSAVPR